MRSRSATTAPTVDFPVAAGPINTSNGRVADTNGILPATSLDGPVGAHTATDALKPVVRVAEGEIHAAVRRGR
ncbi:hypothetical protein GCM10007967_21170 [Xylanimonas ulmi]